MLRRLPFDKSRLLGDALGLIILHMATIPLIITEPAVGYGGGVGLMFLSKPIPNAEAGLGRPNITAVGGFGTENGGAGFRYELARAYGLHMGLDVARGPDDTAVYIQIGSAWARP